MLNSIDHLIVVVKDLEKSTEEFTKLFGFGPAWRGQHKKLGTINSLFQFENLYLELLAKKGSGLGADLVTNTLKAKGEGLSGVAFGTDNIKKFQLSLISKGYESVNIVKSEGSDVDNEERRHWRSLFLPQELSRGLFSFVIQHESQPLKSPNLKKDNIHRLDHVVINSNDPEGFIKIYKDLFGIRLSLDQFVEKWGGRMLFFRINKTTLEVIGKESIKDKPLDTLWGLAWSVENLELTSKRLIKNGIEVSEIKTGRKKDTLVCTIRSHTAQIPTLLIQHL